MSKKDGLLMTNSNIYGLVNPPPVPDKKLGALKHQDISSAAVRWDVFTDLSENVATLTANSGTDLVVRRMVLEQGNVDTTNLNLKTDDSIRSKYSYVQEKLFIGDNTLPKITTNKLDHTGESNYTLDVSGDVHVKGKLVVDGSRVIIRTEVLDISDNNITLNLGGTALSARKGGISLAGADAGFVWNNENGPGGSTNYWDTSGADISTNNIYVKDISSSNIHIVNSLFVKDVSSSNLDVSENIIARDISCTNMEISGNFIAQDVSFNDASLNVLDATQINDFRLGGHIIPTSNATYDLGSAEYKIRHLFLSDNSLWLGDKHKIDVSGGKIRFKKRQLNEIPKGLKKKFDSANLAGLKAATGKNSDNYSDYTLEDYRKYSKVLNPNDTELPIDDIIGQDDLDADEGVMNNINEIIPDASFNNVDISNALVGNSASFKSLTVNGVVIDTNGGVGGGATTGGTEGYTIGDTWELKQTISLSNLPTITNIGNNNRFINSTTGENHIGKHADKGGTTVIYGDYMVGANQGANGGHTILWKKVDGEWVFFKILNTSTSNMYKRMMDIDDINIILTYGNSSKSIYIYRYAQPNFNYNPENSSSYSSISAEYNFGIPGSANIQEISLYQNYLAVLTIRSTSGTNPIYVFKKNGSNRFEANSSYYKVINSPAGGYFYSIDNTPQINHMSMYGNYLAVAYFNVKAKLLIYKKGTDDEWTVHKTIEHDKNLYIGSVKINDKHLIFTTVGYSSTAIRRAFFYKLSEQEEWEKIQEIGSGNWYGLNIIGIRNKSALFAEQYPNLSQGGDYSGDKTHIYSYVTDGSWNEVPIISGPVPNQEHNLESNEYPVALDQLNGTIVIEVKKSGDYNPGAHTSHRDDAGAYYINDMVGESFINKQDAFASNKIAAKELSLYGNPIDLITINGEKNSKTAGSVFVNENHDISINNLNLINNLTLSDNTVKPYIIIETESEGSTIESPLQIGGTCLANNSKFLAIGYFVSSEVRIYKKFSTGYTLHQTLSASVLFNGVTIPSSFYFGIAVAMNEQYLIVGSYGSDSNWKGGFHIFTLNSTTGLWEMEQLSDKVDVQSNTTQENKLIYDSDFNRIKARSVTGGSATSDTSTWLWASTTLKQSLTINDDNVIFVGDLTRDSSAGGKVYLFYLNKGLWTIKTISTTYIMDETGAGTIVTLAPQGTESNYNNDRFGYNVVSFKENENYIILISSPYHSSGRGSISEYKYYRSNTTGELIISKTLDSITGAHNPNIPNSSVFNNAYSGELMIFKNNLLHVSTRDGYTLLVYKRDSSQASNSAKWGISYRTLVSPTIANHSRRGELYAVTNNKMYISSYESDKGTQIHIYDLVPGAVGNGSDPLYNLNTSFTISEKEISFIYNYERRIHLVCDEENENLAIAPKYNSSYKFGFKIYSLIKNRIIKNNKILFGIDLSENILLNNVKANEITASNLKIEKTIEDLSAVNLYSDIVRNNTFLSLNNDLIDGSELESKTGSVQDTGTTTLKNQELFGMYGIKANTTSSVGSFLFIANDKHDYSNAHNTPPAQNSNSNPTWAIYHKLNNEWKYFAYGYWYNTEGYGGSSTNENIKRGHAGYTLATYGDYIAVSAPSFMGDSTNNTYHIGRILIAKLDVSYFNAELIKNESFTNTSTTIRNLNGTKYWKMDYITDNVDEYIEPPSGYNGYGGSGVKYVEKMFGASIEMDDNYLIATMVNGSNSDPPDNNDRKGVVFIYKKDSSGKFIFSQTLKESDGNRYGSRISLNNGYLAVSSPYTTAVNNSYGKIFIYKENDGVWEKVTTVTSDIYISALYLGGEIMNLRGDYLFASGGNGSASTEHKKYYTFIFKRNRAVSEDFVKEHIIEIDPTYPNNTSIFPSTGLGTWRGAIAVNHSTTSFNHFNPNSSNYLYENNILSFPIPNYSDDQFNGRKGKSLFYSNNNGIWTEIDKVLVGKKDDYLGFTTEMVNIDNTIEFLYGYRNFNINQKGGVKRVILPENIKIGNSTDNLNVEIKSKLLTNDIIGKNGEFTSLQINGKYLKTGNFISPDGQGNVNISGKMTVKDLDLSGGNITYNTRLESENDIYGRKYNISNDTYFGSMIRGYGDYMFATEYSNVDNQMPIAGSYYINILKINNDGNYEFVTTDPSQGRIQLPEYQDSGYDWTQFVDRTSGGDLQVYGDYLAAGAPLWRTGTAATGRIFIFKNVNGIWKKDYKIGGSYEYVDVPTDQGIIGISITEGVQHFSKGFGSVIEMNENYLVAGYPGFSMHPTDKNLMQLGIVIIFKRGPDDIYRYHSDISENSYKDMTEGINSDGKYYGTTLSMYENYLAVSAPSFYSKLSDGTLSNGIVFLYKEINNVWTKIQTIGNNPPHNELLRLFGNFMKLTKNYLFVSGTVRHTPTDSNGYYSDKIYIYKKSTEDSWNYLKSITITSYFKGNNLIYSSFLNELPNSALAYQTGSSSSNYKAIDGVNFYAGVSPYPAQLRHQLQYSEKQGTLYVPVPGAWTDLSGVIVDTNFHRKYGKVMIFQNGNDTWDNVQTIVNPDIDSLGSGDHDCFGRGIYYNEKHNKLSVSRILVNGNDNTNNKTDVGIIHQYGGTEPEIKISGSQSNFNIKSSVTVTESLNVVKDISCASLTINGSSIDYNSTTDLEIRNLEVHGTLDIKNNKKLTANDADFNDASFNNIEFKKNVKIKSLYSGNLLFRVGFDEPTLLDEFSTNEPKSYIKVRYLNQTNNHIIMAVGGEPGDTDAQQTVNKGRVIIYKINNSDLGGDPTTEIHRIDLFNVPNASLFSTKYYSEILYLGYNRNTIILAMDNETFYIFIYNGTEWVYSSNFKVTIPAGGMNGFPAGDYTFYTLASHSNTRKSIILENDYFIVGCPQAKKSSQWINDELGLIAIFKYDSNTNTYILKDIITLIDPDNNDRSQDAYIQFGRYIQYNEGLIYVANREYWTASTANGGPGAATTGPYNGVSGVWITIDIFSENNNGTWTGQKKIFLQELFEPTAFISGGGSYYGGNNNSLIDLAEGYNHFFAFQASKKYIVIYLADVGIHNIALAILKKQENKVYDWSGYFWIDYIERTDTYITRYEYETDGLTILRKSPYFAGSGSFNISDSYLYLQPVSSGWEAKTDNEIINEFANGADVVNAIKNTTEDRIYIFNMDTLDMHQVLHKSAVSDINGSFHTSIIIDNECELVKPNLFLASFTHSDNVAGGEGALISLKADPNIINNENLVKLNTVQIDNLVMKNNIRGNNVKLHPPTKGVVLDISGDNTGVGNNGVLVDLKTTGSDAISSSMIRFSNANTTTDGGLRPFIIGAYDTGFHIMEESNDWPTTRVMVRNNGNVGIGLNMPSRKLEVNGDISGTNIIATEGIKLPVEDSAGAPSTTPAVGTMVFNSADNKLYIYNGAWKSYSPDP